MSVATIELHVPLSPKRFVSLATLRPGESGYVVAVGEPGELGERLLEMGLTPGVEVCLVRHGPMGDPMQLSVRGALLSVRRALADTVRITRR
ncbi:MAG: FeoA family protein [Myxococcota bacterium]